MRAGPSPGRRLGGGLGARSAGLDGVASATSAHAAASVVGPGHQQADLLGAGVPAGTSPAMRPRYMTAIRSASPSTSSSSVETSTTAVPSSRSLDDAAVHELHRADVEAAGRLGHDEQLQRTRQLAGEHHLLLVAAGQRARGRFGARRAARRTPRRGAAALLPISPSSSEPRGANGAWSYMSRTRFSATENEPTSPSCSRSSGT